ncbi:hypothetical protein A2U01_0075312 [Trifolium medium]|uniref:Uncharacterized protein n=1 Tax=Trifolium medium TaxID=97028 RepID=A0A392T169_9FABA|nr:hypothetical protein [Trifolium medium]
MLRCANLKHQLDQLNGRLKCRDVRRVAGVEYHRPSVGTDERVRFTNMKLQNNDYMRTMFTHYSTKGPIDLDATLVRFVQS